MAIPRAHHQESGLSAQDALQKIYRYCAYQERSHLEVKTRLCSFGLSSDHCDEIISRLIIEGFLNEERFAKAFTGGKFRMQKWGRNKIAHQLESKGLTKNCIQHGLLEISEPDYQNTLREVVLKRLQLSDEGNAFKKRDKIARYAIARGFEADLVWETVRELVP